MELYGMDTYDNFTSYDQADREVIQTVNDNNKRTEGKRNSREAQKKSKQLREVIGHALAVIVYVALLIASIKGYTGIAVNVLCALLVAGAGMKLAAALWGYLR